MTEKEYRLNLRPFRDFLSGSLEVIEDFVPISDEECLVNAGSDLRTLTHILRCEYGFDRGILTLNPREVMAVGGYLRLGHMKEGRLIYSDGWEGPHQPHQSAKHAYYTDGAPNGRIYQDGKIFNPRVSGFVEMGKPWEHDGWLYFEANTFHESPRTWEIWRAQLDTRDAFYVTDGANPAIYNKTLYHGRWNEQRDYLVVTRSL